MAGLPDASLAPAAVQVHQQYPANRLFLAHGTRDFAVINFARLRFGGAKECKQYIEKVIR